MANVVIADPVYLSREGLRNILEKDTNYSLIGEINKSTEFWPKVKSFKPDILVINNNAKEFVETDDLNKMHEFSPGTKILIISDHNKKENILNVIKNGVLGYLTKECEEKEIKNALSSILKGEKFFCNKILDVILENKLDENNDGNKLTEREIGIIQLIAEKYTNQEISEKLFISIHTVYTHRRNIMKKLKLKSPVELILYAIDSGIIQPYQN